MATASETLEQGADTLNHVGEERDYEDEREQLFVHADERRQLRKHVDKVELRLAFRDLADGVRGLIRVSPFTAVVAGALVGAALARRSKSKPRQAPRR